MKKLNIILIMIFVVGLVTAGVLSNWNSEIDLTKVEEDIIKLRGEVDAINVSISKITCDDKICWAWAKQKGVINSRWVGDKFYCSLYEKITIQEETYETENCLEFTDYTTSELQGFIKDDVEMKLGNWANDEMNRSVEIEVVTGEGVITNKK